MFVNERLVFLHMQKAAGTFVVGRLSQRLPGIVRDGHAPLREGKRGRVVAAAIRNPWDWYVSLWAYGCMGEGGVHGHLTAPRGQIMGQTLRAALTGRAPPGDAIAA